MTGSVVVVGGGIAGLTAAWRLTSAGVPVTVLESSDRWGGKIQTTEFAGSAIDSGPDAFLARRPEAVGLCHELGLADELVAPGTGAAFLWTRGALQPIPTRTVLGIPTGIGWWRQTKAVSWPGKLRSGLDPFLPTTRRGDDRSVGNLVAGRLGRQVASRLVDPLLGGINAGSIDRLSLEAAAPQVASAAATGRSLTRALRGAQQKAAPPEVASTPVFNTLRSGLGHLIVELVSRLQDAGADLRTGTSVTGLTEHATGWSVITTDGALNTKSVVLATPAFATAKIVGGIAPDAAVGLAAIEYASVVLVTLALPGDVDFPDASGFLVPVDGRLLTACTWFTTKWPHTRRSSEVIVRLSAGKVGDERAIAMDDEELVATLREELATATGCDAEPVAERVTRWPRSFPQYDVGHLERIDRIEASLPKGLLLAGAALRGVGIPACIASAERAAEAITRSHAGSPQA